MNLKESKAYRIIGIVLTLIYLLCLCFNVNNYIIGMGLMLYWLLGFIIYGLIPAIKKKHKIDIFAYSLFSVLTLIIFILNLSSYIK